MMKEKKRSVRSALRSLRAGDLPKEALPSPTQLMTLTGFLRRGLSLFGDLVGELVVLLCELTEFEELLLRGKKATQ